MRIKREEAEPNSNQKGKSGGLPPKEKKKKSRKGLRYFKPKAFVEQYVIDYSPVNAWRRCGYSSGDNNLDATLAGQALNRPEVQQLITDHQRKASENFEITEEMVLKELAKIAFSDISQVMSWENNNVIIRNSRELSPQITGAIQSIVQTINQTGGGRIEVKMYDKKSALIDLGRHIGMFWEPKQTSADPLDRARRIKMALQEIQKITCPEEEEERKKNG